MAGSTAMDVATSELLTGSLRELFGSLTDGRDLGPALAELGWDDVLADDPAGATTLLFLEHGRGLVTSRALDDVVLAELAAALPAPSGTRAVLYPHPADADDPAAPGGPLRGVLLGRLDAVAEVVVPAASTTEGPTVLLTVPASEIAPLAAPLTGFDSEPGWFVVAGDRPSSSFGPVDAGSAWTRAVAAAHRALAAEILGVCEGALGVVAEHTASRVQFGRPIASFQAVRHRLAECHVAIAAARSVLDAAWTASAASDGGRWAATLAKLQAGRAQAELMRHVVQVSGAMGISREGPLHRYVTRAAALDALLGGHLALTESMGVAMLVGADLDPVVEL